MTGHSRCSLNISWKIKEQVGASFPKRHIGKKKRWQATHRTSFKVWVGGGPARYQSETWGTAAHVARCSAAEATSGFPPTDLFLVKEPHSLTSGNKHIPLFNNCCHRLTDLLAVCMVTTGTTKEQEWATAPITVHVTRSNAFIPVLSEVYILIAKHTISSFAKLLFCYIIEWKHTLYRKQDLLLRSSPCLGDKWGRKLANLSMPWFFHH